MVESAFPATLPGTIKHGLRLERDEGDDDTGVRDNQILSDAQVTRLIGAAREIDAREDWNGDLFRMVLVLAATGTQFSQAARLRVRGPAAGPIAGAGLAQGPRQKWRDARSHRQDVYAALQPAAMKRAGSDYLLERWSWRQIDFGKWEKAERRPWQAAELTRPWKALRERAGMTHAIPYALRHSSIVRGIKSNLPLKLIAELHDTSTAMIEKHYGRWVAHGLEEMAARAVVPLVPQDEGGKVIKLARKR